MRSNFFPARIRRFLRFDTFEADIDLYFGVYVRRTITIAPQSCAGPLNRSLPPDDLTKAYRDTVVHLRVDRVGLRDDRQILMVFALKNEGTMVPFIPRVPQSEGVGAA